MITNFEELVFLCNQELQEREYASNYYKRIINNWNSLRTWMQSNNLTEFDEQIGNKYCKETLGTHLMPHNPPRHFKEKMRSVRMLISYQKNGDFEFRSPRIEYIFEGRIGDFALKYLEFCKNDLILATKTIDNKRLYLFNFCRYINRNNLQLDELSIEKIENFFKSMNYTLASRHNSARTIKLFLTYAYDNGYSNKNCSIFILSDSYKKDCKIPTTYEEDEIKKLISSIERASTIGKRDYLILLLAAEYGWRAKDITKFQFSDIDWDNNIIKFNQHKTDSPVELPLLASIGNAIIDYLKYARPKTSASEIIVSMENANKGKPLSSPTIHSVVTKYMKQAGIKNWQQKKHGPHSIRHSLATNLLKKNVTMPIISTIMGHQKTETTNVYISVDYDKLKQCARPMPPLRSPSYDKEGSYDKI